MELDFSINKLNVFSLFFRISINGKEVFLILCVISAFVGKRNDFSFYVWIAFYSSEKLCVENLQFCIFNLEIRPIILLNNIITIDHCYIHEKYLNKKIRY